MKRKTCMPLLIGCMALMLAGCQTAQSTESDSVRYSEIAAEGEIENSKEADRDNKLAEEALLSDKENKITNDI